jgi:hypothetical protein
MGRDPFRPVAAAQAGIERIPDTLADAAATAEKTVPDPGQLA